MNSVILFRMSAFVDKIVDFEKEGNRVKT